MYKIKGRVNRLICELESLLNGNTYAVTSIDIRQGKLNFPCQITDITDNFTEYYCGDVWSTENFDNFMHYLSLKSIFQKLMRAQW